MTHGSLFSGIGGFDLAAKWMGWENVFHVERDPFCRQVLTHHFPKSQSFDDVKTFDATPFRGRIRVLSGGFPCQPFSAAGKRAGTSDDRYLWPEMFRIIREARPTYVVAENVRGLLSWNEGLVLDTVCADLEGEGYEVFPTILPAASVNAPHRRDRIWIVAYRHDGFGEQPHQEIRSRGNAANDGGADATNACGMGRERRGSQEAEGREGQRPWVQPDVEGQSSGGNVADTDGQVLERGHGEGAPAGAAVPPIRTQPLSVAGGWETFPTQPPVCGGDDGLPERLDGITFPKWRRESIKAYGNAIVPQVALQIFQALEDSNRRTA
jgi:DNA (cytosine-5)-methyltransferase 1